MAKAPRSAPHPGKVLLDFLKRIGLSTAALANACGVPRTRVERVTTEQIGMTVDTTLRISKVLGTPPDYWLDLQRDFDLQAAQQQMAGELAKIRPSPNIRKAIDQRATLHSTR